MEVVVKAAEPKVVFPLMQKQYDVITPKVVIDINRKEVFNPDGTPVYQAGDVRQVTKAQLEKEIADYQAKIDADKAILAKIVEAEKITEAAKA